MMKQKKADHLDKHLGARLKQLRTRRGLSMAQIGELIEVTPQQISRYESGQHRITATGLYRLARGLDVPVSWFFESYIEDQDELGRVKNIVHKSRTEWQPASRNDHEQRLLSLWKDLPSDHQRQQIIHLLEAFV